MATAGHRRLLGPAQLALASCVLVACSGAQKAELEGWTTAQAESIAVIRGMPVRVRGCRGVGRREGERYLRFNCVAGARLSGEHFDTVGVLYGLRPLSRFRIADPSYRLTNVRFTGGPGIP
jgi:hypothetical protein